MTKLDFSIHLLMTLRELTKKSRLPVVALLTMLELSRHNEGEWVTGIELAKGLGAGIDSNRIVSCCRESVAAGLLERCSDGRQVNAPVAFRLPAKGRAIVKRLLETEKKEVAA